MAEEQKTQEGQQGEAAPAKNKKINKLDARAINAKIGEMEEKKQTTSRYYKHLLQRKKEAEGV
ncbi:MAG TPA: hypothetical protein PK573_01105 [Spirochaetota bacterium]|nr:hypothetical protein [Spirochaetota bacterium]HRZ25964.1 hypothetical protein [Spirochaetota bacterium]HSA14258.1 hypothetical protein [Spirochaetota bacterium]